MSFRLAKATETLSQNNSNNEKGASVSFFPGCHYFAPRRVCASVVQYPLASLAFWCLSLVAFPGFVLDIIWHWYVSEVGIPLGMAL